MHLYENSMKFLEDMQSIEKIGTVFMGMGVLFAIVSFFLYRKLLRKDSLKVDFRQGRNQASDPPEGTDQTYGPLENELMEYRANMQDVDLFGDQNGMN